MILRWTQSSYIGATLSISFGIIAFIFITGGEILNPTYTDWLMDGDPATHWLGWQFFRNTPFFQWPLGANTNYGMDISSSIVFTDSIPILAFIFRPLSYLLPESFQYIGLWLLLCFSLQSFFSWKLLSLFTKNKLLPLIGCIFFTIAPIYLFRLSGHYALFGHWVILVGLYFYFSKSFSILHWIVILTIASLIHAYLLAMVLSIWITDLIQRNILKQITFLETINFFFITGIYLIIIMWATGYFMLGSSIGSDGFGFYRMNLLSLIDSNTTWSTFLVDKKGGNGEHEGFNYLGIGMLGLGILASYELINKFTTNNKAKFFPLLLMSILLFLYAISNHIAFGTYEILSYSLPDITRPITQTFRISARFFWPVYYLIYLAIFYIIFTRVKPNIAIIICLFFLCFQVLDFFTGFNSIRNKFQNPPDWSSVIKSPLWNKMAHEYKKIIFVLPRHTPKNWMSLSKFASERKMSLNIGYFARIDQKRLYESRLKLTQSIINNQLNNDAIYIFEDNNLWKIAINQLGNNDIAGILDGFRILAPGFRIHAQKKKYLLDDIYEFKHINDTKEAPSRNSLSKINLSLLKNNKQYKYNGKQLSFKSSQLGNNYLISGWTTPDSWGSWSVGDRALLRLDIANTINKDVDLEILSHAYLAKYHPYQNVDIYVNGNYIQLLKYTGKFNYGIRKLKIPKNVLEKSNGHLLIEFHNKNPMSPSDLGLSSDYRKFGIGLISIKLEI